VDRCPSLEKLFGRVAPVDDHGRYLIDHIAPALVECNCSLDLPALRSLMWRLLRNPYPTSGLAVHVDAAASPPAPAADMAWREASKRFMRETRSISVRVK